MVHDIISSVPQLQTNQFKSQMTLVFSSNVLWLDSSLPENQTTTFPEHNRIQGFRTRTISTEKSKKGLLPGGNSYSRTQTLTHLEYSWLLLNPKGTFPTHQVSWMSKRSASGPRMAHPWGCWWAFLFKMEKACLGHFFLNHPPTQTWTTKGVEIQDVVWA